MPFSARELVVNNTPVVGVSLAPTVYAVTEPLLDPVDFDDDGRLLIFELCAVNTRGIELVLESEGA